MLWLIMIIEGENVWVDSNFPALFGIKNKNHQFLKLWFKYNKSYLSCPSLLMLLLQKLRKGQIPPDGAIQKHRMQHQKSMDPTLEGGRPIPAPRESRQQEPMETQRRWPQSPYPVWLLETAPDDF